jgi:signal transduction histidine kinase
MSPHILITVIGITVFVICASIINTYIFTKANKTLLLALYTAAVSSMLLWSIVKLLYVVSPIAAIKTKYNSMQYVLALFFIASLLCFVAHMYTKKVLYGRAWRIILPSILLIIILIWVYFLQPSKLMSTYILIIMFLAINLSVFFNRYKIFPEIEMSLDSIVEYVRDRVAGFGLTGTLVDMNLRALQKELIPVWEKTLFSFIEQINNYSKNNILEINKIINLENDSYENEICIVLSGNLTYYIFIASIIRNKNGEKMGTVCTLRDITENKLISMELDNKNRELQSLNKELGNYIRIADSLEEEKERAQIAREIHNTIGQKMTEILSVLEVIKLTEKEDSEVFEKPLNEAIQSCRSVLTEIRVVVSRLIPDKDKGVK